MTAPQRAQSDEQAPARPNGMPTALAFVICVGGAAIGVMAAMWLGSVQCIKVGGCA